MARLKSIAKFISDGDWVESKDQSPDGIRLIQTGNIGNGEYLDKSGRAKFISQDTFLKLKCTALQPNDILISRLPDPIGRSCIIPGDIGHAITAVDCTILRLNPEICESKYFIYYTQSPYYQLRLSTFFAGSTRTRISRKNLETVEVPLLTLPEQQHIVGVLDSICDLISLRKQQLAKLDELVKARFVEMFGDEQQMSRWPCGYVDAVADVCVGVVIKPTQYYASTGIPAFRSQNVGAMRVKNSDWIYFTEEGHKKNQKSIVRENDVLVVRSGAPGTACVAGKEFSGYNAVDIIIAHPDQNKINPIFLAQFTNLPHGMNQIREKTGGAAQQHFNVSGYKSLRLILPPLDYQNQFAKFVEHTDKSRLTIQQSLAKLEVLKKALMQEYFG